jgi:hypothetical protein
MGVAHYVYPMGLMSAVAFSWGVMLLIANRQPLDRRWVLIPTMLVVALLGLVGLHAGLTEVIPLMRAVPVFIVSMIVLSILTYGYINARDSR